MEMEAESSCCQEAQRIVDKMTEFENSSEQELKCITQHPGFTSVCLDVHVLDTAYLQYKQQYGNLLNHRQDE